MVKIIKTSWKRISVSLSSLSNIHTHTPPTHYRSNIIRILVPVLFFTVLAVSSCYTQFHPPAPTRPPVAGTPDSLQQHSSADTVYHIYQEPDPFAPYYYRRYNRWDHYYNTPWWYGSRYYNNYYYRYPYRTTPYQYVPSGGSSGSSTPAEKKQTNRRRRLQINESSGTRKPAQRSEPAATEETQEETDSASGQQDTEKENQDTQSNRRRKLDF